MTSAAGNFAVRGVGNFWSYSIGKSRSGSVDWAPGKGFVDFRFLWPIVRRCRFEPCRWEWVAQVAGNCLRIIDWGKCAGSPRYGGCDRLRGKAIIGQ